MGIKTVKPSGFQEFTASGNFTVPAAVTLVYVSGCSGGQGTSSDTGGAAGYSVVRKPVAVTPGQVIAVTIGAGGASSASIGHAPAGGATSFGALLSISGLSQTVPFEIRRTPFASFGQSGTGVSAPGSSGYLLIEW